MGDRRAWWRSQHWAVLLIVLFTLLIQLGLPIGFDGDLAGFERRSLMWVWTPKAIYTDTECNYPALGALFSEGLMHGIAKLEPRTSWPDRSRSYQAILAAVDVVNTLLLAEILLALGIGGALWVALLIHVLPSTWVGGALWGQIDGFTLLFTLLSLRGFVKVARKCASAEVRLAPVLKDYAVGALCISAGVLTKQLFLECLPGLLPFAGMATFLIWKRHGRGGVVACAAIGAFAVGALFAPDLYFWIPRGHSTLLGYILFGGGSSHGDHLAPHGFNIWVFLGRDMWSSSDIPFWHGLTPRIAGYALYSLSLAALGAPLFSCLARERLGRETRGVFGLLTLALALEVLAFNLFMTGVHERYLYPFYPLALVGLFCLRREGARWASAWVPPVCAMGCAYGAFVYTVLVDDGRSPVRSWVADPRIVALLHFLLFAGLSAFLLALLFRDEAWATAAVPRILARETAGS